jgi:hypothetical protein
MAWSATSHSYRGAVGLPAIIGPVQVLIAAPAFEAQGDICPESAAGFAVKCSEILRHETDFGI